MPRRRDPRHLRVIAGAAMTLACVGGGVASAQTPPSPTTTTTTTTSEATAPGDTDATTTGGREPARGTGGTGGSGTSGPGGSGRARLKLERATPQRLFFSGKRRAVFRFEIGGGRRVDLHIEAFKRGSREVERHWSRANVAPGRVESVQWRGNKRNHDAAPKGQYYFRVRRAGGDPLNREHAQGNRRLHLYPNLFPVRSRHSYGDGYGAGRGHKGQDLFARCGAKIVAARAGKVQWRAYQGGGAGNYLVIDGKDDRRDYVYMHLRHRASVREGEYVRANEEIGRVGQTGNASGCHLHFELWKGDWYGGGSPMRSVTRNLRHWDGWS
jgi:murein DD-endopeptidase MepM/ murein hydrolase activator NlpD